MNGPHIHPGANYIEDERGHLINLSYKSVEQRDALSKTLLTNTQYDNTQPIHKLSNTSQSTTKRVYRHLTSGDMVLMNRQPTLHKPSMMSHTVRVMRGMQWQTLRMSYANCNSYNADFDGDEMNMHYPQTLHAQAELKYISNNDNQYLVPTDGAPLRGLIQDHVDSGVLLTKLDRLINRHEFTQLLFGAIDDIDITMSSYEIILPVPCLLKPIELWSGKQLVSALLKLLINNKPLLNLTSKSKVSGTQWAQHSYEQNVIFNNGDLLCGVLDKSQFGDASYGLVHACYELYGGILAGDLLSTLGRLFTIDLQNQGHTCGIDDMFLVKSAEERRTKLINESIESGINAAKSFVNMSDNTADDIISDQQLQSQLRLQLAKEPMNRAKLDGVMKSCMNTYTSSIISTCLPIGQVKSFPDNQMARMILSGAKGSMVNFSQICCLLGQQELEGRRVPLTATGRTLPSFRPYDPSPRAGGYVSNRFLTGIRPQEYYFHWYVIYCNITIINNKYIILTLYFIHIICML